VLVLPGRRRLRRLDAFLEALAARPPAPAVANPYGGAAGARRRHNLRTYLTRVAALSPTVALVGEAPGYRGCAVTGVPFTSRRVLATGGGAWGLFGAGYVTDAGLGQPWTEATATIVWRHLPLALAAPPVTWNAFPFHAHPPGAPGGNRRPTAPEVAEGAAYLRLALDLVPGLRPIAVGRVAALALADLGVTPLAVLRHPAHGGGARFAAGLAAAAAALATPPAPARG